MRTNTLKVSVFLGISATLCLPMLLYARAMHSGNYSIQSDSVNIGGVDSQSASYAGQDTLGQVSSGNAASASYAVMAGYQQMQAGSISISASPDVAFSNIAGIGESDTSTSSQWTIITDNVSGYSLSVRAATSPALVSATFGSFFADYVPAGSDPDYGFSVSPTQSVFAFSPEGDDVTSRYKDNGISCNTGALDTVDVCWDGFTTSNAEIATSGSANAPSGTPTVLKYRVATGSEKIQDAGTYSAVITLTAVTL